MHNIQQRAFELEMNKAKEFYLLNQFENSFFHLERAHILGQRSVTSHTISHYWMLKISLRNKDFREILGQLIRIPLGVFGSSLGIVPNGNTGRSNVGILQRMDIPKDLKEVMQKED